MRFKVTRLTNKLESNQKQWVETLQEIQLHASKDHLVSDCGACSEFVLGWGGGRVFQIVGYTKLCSYSHLCCLSLMDTPCILIKRQSTLGFQTTSNFFSHLVQITETIPSYKINNVFVVDRLQI